MAAEYPSVDISKGNTPDLAELAEEVHRTNRPLLLKRAEEDIAVISPVAKPAPKRKPRQRIKPVTEDDPLFRLIGIGDSGKGDISENKHEYLLRAKRSHNDHG